MIEALLVLGLLAGGLWLFFSLLGLLLRVLLGMIGLLLCLIALPLLLLLSPLMLLAAIPPLLPMLLIGLIVWLVLRRPMVNLRGCQKFGVSHTLS
jgi:hypothetical protein